MSTILESISEADVVFWMASKAYEIEQRTKIEITSLSLSWHKESGQSKSFCFRTVFCNGDNASSTECCDAAANDLLSSMDTPDKGAKRLRDQIEALKNELSKLKQP